VKQGSSRGTDRDTRPSEPECGRWFTPVQGILLAIILSIVLWVLISLFVGSLIPKALIG
jgi:hypothetical protein